MKTVKLLAAFALLTSAVFAQKTATVQLPEFSKIKVQSIATVYVRQDSIQSVKIVGNLIQTDEVRVSGNTLQIDNSTDNTYFISVKELDEVSINGNGNVYGESAIGANKISLEISGTGKIRLELKAHEVEASVPGAGKIELSGSADYAKLNVSGSGKIDAMAMQVRRCDADISGLGKISVDAKDELNSNISGSGKIEYKTAPAVMNDKISGIGSVKGGDSSNDTCCNADTTRIQLGKSQVWFIGQKNIKINKEKNTKPIWAGIELGLNSYMDNDGSLTLSKGKENFELKTAKAVSFSLNFLQKNIQFGKSNVWLFTGLGVTWNNYRFANDIMLTKGDYTSAYHDTTPGVNHLKSKLVASYLTVPVMMEFFTSKNYKHAFHLGVGGMFGLLIGSHTKYKVEMNDETTKLKDFSDYNLNPFRYGFRAAIGYGKVNLFADYYASTLFKDNKGPVLYPVNVGITLIGF
jgi:hypothetical protein